MRSDFSFKKQYLEGPYRTLHNRRIYLVATNDLAEDVVIVFSGVESLASYS